MLFDALVVFTTIMVMGVVVAYFDDAHKWVVNKDLL